MMPLRTCVSPEGKFVFGIHRPCFKVENLRENDYISCLGVKADGTEVKNNMNFPEGNVNVAKADIIYEIPNPFPFRGTTYINSVWADKTAENPKTISLPPGPEVHFSLDLKQWLEKKGLSRKEAEDFFEIMPQPMLIALADTSTDPEELSALAKISCSFLFKEDEKTPCGLVFKQDENGKIHPEIKNHTLFEIIANNKYLPDDYKKIMVLKPGVQGNSEITGEWKESANRAMGGSSSNNRGNDKNCSKDSDSHSKITGTHVFEYLRKNSYIPWGHFAANTADDTIRYRIKDLSFRDIKGIRHLYYQRTFARLAGQLDIPRPCSKKTFSEDQLEKLRLGVMESILSGNGKKLFFNGSLWGWNFGFGYAQSGYRLHASHQQIHQQYAMIPRIVPDSSGNQIPSYACGDMVADFISNYRQVTGRNFFENYIKAIKSNTRTDLNPNGPSSLIIFQDKNILLFVPKAQTSQWELQLMATKKCGNILEADSSMRKSLDKGMLAALKLLESMGAVMITCMEFSKRFDSKDSDQRLLYSFMPKIPQSPGAFSEAQLRWINGHYPEDFALTCSLHFTKLSADRLS